MSGIFIKRMRINQLRRLNNINIELGEEARKRLIVTGKNGSGKTALLQEMKRYFAGGGELPDIFL